MVTRKKEETRTIASTQGMEEYVTHKRRRTKRWGGGEVGWFSNCARSGVSIKHSVRKMLLHKNSIHYYATQSSAGYRLLLPPAISWPDLRTGAYNTSPPRVLICHLHFPLRSNALTRFADRFYMQLYVFQLPGSFLFFPFSLFFLFFSFFFHPDSAALRVSIWSTLKSSEFVSHLAESEASDGNLTLRDE